MILRRLQLAIKHLLGRDLYLTPKLHIPLEHYGNRHADWSVPADFVSASSIVYSFGIGEDASWDMQLIAAKGCVIHAFDPTPKSLAWVGREIFEPRFLVHPWGLAAEDGTIDLWLPANPSHVSASCRPSPSMSSIRIRVPCRSLPSIMAELGHSRVDVLKMDIEGAEYEVLDSIINDGTISRIGALLVEFHHWMPSFRLGDTRAAMKRMTATNLLPAWVSDSGHELLFVRST